MANLHSVLKSRDIPADRGPSSQGSALSSSHYRCESWTTKKVEHWRTDAFKLRCWRGLLRVPQKARSNQPILKEINPGYSLEGPMLKLKFQYIGHLMQRADSLKRPWCWERLSQKKRATEDKVVEWHHRFSRHALGQTRGDAEGQGSLACSSVWGCKELDMTWQLSSSNTCLNIKNNKVDCMYVVTSEINFSKSCGWTNS